MRRMLRWLLGVSLLFAGWPAQGGEAQPFEMRGFYVDLRTQVMTLPALKRLAETVAGEGINTLIVEWEATFPFHKHAVLCNRYAYTEAEVREFVAHCSSLGLDVIPLQNCFGHCEYILRHDRYAALREDRKEVSQVCPTQIGEAEKFFREIFAEVTALHPSPYLHIGADETRLLGRCRRCAEKAEKEGVSALFVDYVGAMCRIAIELGKTPVIWADMLLQHPEAIGKLPREVIVADWNYGWEPTHFGQIERVTEAGFTVWGASSLRSAPDNLYLTQWDKHFSNLTTFVPYARAHGYKGMIETSWSTSGQYGFTYDNAWEIIEMQPVRQVYPLGGFDVLIRAFGRAVADEAPLDVESYVRGYARDHYGFDEKGADLLCDYFRMPQKAVTGHSAKTIERTIEMCEALRRRMAEVKPPYHRDDFGHLRLMLDIRIHYLHFKLAEKEYESDRYDAAGRAAMAQRFERLLDENRRLQKRYVRMNRSLLKNPEESFGNGSYTGKIRAIYSALKPQ